jgi:hypothetical protein
MRREDLVKRAELRLVMARESAAGGIGGGVTHTRARLGSVPMGEPSAGANRLASCLLLHAALAFVLSCLWMHVCVLLIVDGCTTSTYDLGVQRCDRLARARRGSTAVHVSGISVCILPFL